MDKKVCTACLLPDTYPGIKFTDSGICNFCKDHKKITYLGDEALIEKITSYKTQKKEGHEQYDCVLGFSGGRDSSYLFYYLTQKLNLKVLAYSADSGFIPAETIENMERMSSQLDVKLVIEKHGYMHNCFKHHFNTWQRKPSPGMLGMLCTGCRLGYDLGIYRFTKKNGIPVIVEGGTPFEGLNYKLNLLRINPDDRNSSFIAGYLANIKNNPRWLGNLKSLYVQANEFYHHYLFRKKFYKKKLRKAGITKISPYHSYIKWEEKEIESILQDTFGWQKSGFTETTWRGDCHIAFLKDFLYKKLLGFNDKTDHFSCLIRDGQISRSEAIMRIEKEDRKAEENVGKILQRLGLESDLLR